MVFSGSLALTSILAAIFVFLFVQTLGEQGFPGNGGPYKFVVVAVGLLLVLTAITSTVTFYRQNQAWGWLEILFTVILIALGILPAVGVVFLLS